MARSADNRLSTDFLVCWQPVVTSKMSGDNRLSQAKCLVTTGCHQQKVCWQPAVYFLITICTLFNNIRHLMINSAINCFAIHMYEYRDFYTKNIHLCVWSNDIVSIIQCLVIIGKLTNHDKRYYFFNSYKIGIFQMIIWTLTAYLL